MCDFGYPLFSLALVVNHLILIFSFNLYISKISLINSKYMYDIENKFKFASS